MAEVGYFVFKGTGPKCVVSYGDDETVELSAQDATALTLIYLSDRLSEQMVEIREALQEIRDKVDRLDTAIDNLKDPSV